MEEGQRGGSQAPIADRVGRQGTGVPPAQHENVGEPLPPGQARVLPILLDHELATRPANPQFQAAMRALATVESCLPPSDELSIRRGIEEALEVVLRLTGQADRKRSFAGFRTCNVPLVPQSFQDRFDLDVVTPRRAVSSERRPLAIDSTDGVGAAWSSGPMLPRTRRASRHRTVDGQNVPFADQSIQNRPVSYTIETQIAIDAPPERVWPVIADFARYPEWNPFILRVAGTVREGASVRYQFEFPQGIRIWAMAKILRYSAGDELLWEAHFLSRRVFNGAHHFRVRPGDNGSTVFLHGESFSGFLSPLAWPLIRLAGPRIYNSLNIALKQRVGIRGER